MSPVQNDLTADAKPPPPRGGDELPDDPRLLQAVQEYLKQLEAGRAPDRHDLLRRYADIAKPLTQCLDGLDLVHKVAVSPKQPTLTPAAATDEPHAGNPLGDFQILSEIGRGGMGVVYEALQLSLGRRVALKVLPFAATFDAKHLQRFHNEAHAAALLHHTNIVPVYAVGCERGVHFYAMQLIEGQTLAEVIRLLRDQGSGVRDQGSGARGQDLAGMIEYKSGLGAQTLYANESLHSTNRPAATASPLTLALSTHRSRQEVEYYRTVARFMLQAADALEHAHQYGIVHRDVKPGNLMLDELGRLWITDFGLAQFHSDASLTQTGDIFGTLRYMSPEQASGQRGLLDHRTDVYSLGATMYELVTLQPLFAGQDRHELLRQIIQEEPRAPRAVDKSIPVELETIILKAVNKNPADRYASAKKLAADLQRYLDDKPILATRPSMMEQARKWARRHPSAVIAAMVLLFCGAVGLAVSTAMIAGEQALTRQAYEAERKKAAEAEQRFQLARRSADEMIRLAEEELADNPAMQSLRRRLLEAALAYYQEFIELRSEDADAQADLGITRDRVKKILNDLAVLQGAGQQFLLKEPTVLDDMRLSDSQRDQMTGLLERMDKQRQDTFRERLKPDEFQKRFLELVRANDAAISAVLTPAQLHRLRQIALQCQGSMAFHDADVAAALKLTADQKKQIRGITALVFFDKGPFGRPLGSKGPPPGKFGDEKQKKGPQNKNTLNQVLALLTPEQKAVWAAMTGDPFERAGLIFFPGPPPGGGFPPPPPKDRKGR